MVFFVSLISHVINKLISYGQNNKREKSLTLLDIEDHRTRPPIHT